MQPLLDADDHIAQRRVLAKGRDQFLRKPVGFADVERHEFRERFACHPHRSASPVQSRAMALGAFPAHHKRREPSPETFAVGVPKTLLEIRDHAGKRHRLRFAHPPHLERKLTLARPVQNRIPGLLGQVFPRRIGIKGQLFGQLLQQGVVLDDQVLSADAPGLERAAAHRFVRVGHDQLRHEPQLPAQPAAGSARTVTVIE